jgi:hypothetical protein
VNACELVGLGLELAYMLYVRLYVICYMIRLCGCDLVRVSLCYNLFML